MKCNSLFDQVRQEAFRLGLSDLGIVAVSDSVSLESFKKWIASGSNSSMDYLEKNFSARRHPSGVFPKARTLLVAVLSLARISQEFKPLLDEKDGIFRTGDNSSFKPEITGQIIPYALYPDYHGILKKKLQILFQFLKKLYPETEGRVVVDTAPLPEKEWAVRAGLGQIGRQSLLIHPQFGCSIFIGTLLVSLDYEQFGPFISNDPVPPDKRTPLNNNLMPAENLSLSDNLTFDSTSDSTFDLTSDSTSSESQIVENLTSTENLFPAKDCCIGCCQCLQRCPTGAIQSDRTIDGRKCLNFWTIENRDFDPNNVPNEIRKALGNRLFGCDECVQACRWNRINNAVPAGEMDLERIEKMTDEEFKKAFRKTPLYRATLAGMKRNVDWIKKNS